MSLANLTINITANSAPAKRGLDDVRAAAKSSMQDSSAAVDDFRARILRASEDLQSAAREMGSGWQAANDAMARDTERTQDAIDALVDKTAEVKFDSMHERIAAAFGTAFGAGYAAAQTWIEKTEEWVKTKLLVMGVGIAVGVTAATALAVYTAYKAITGTYDFVKGLFTGESYKSENIDALIAVNKEVKQLQDGLFISAQHASALRDALDRLGVDKGDYIAVQEGATKAMKTNGEELDRLGIKYKDANGKLLETDAFLQNVKAALDEYTEGYDRNAAAVAIGVGSYKQLVEAMKVTQVEVAASKERIDEYGLAIGPQTQAYIEQYQKAVREFQHESELTAQGFKRAIADNVMPILTDLAEFFRDGFPFAVRVFRYTMAEVTSMFYGWKSVIDLVWDTWKGLYDSMKSGVVAIATALLRAAQGDFQGAWDAITQGWDKVTNRMSKAWDEVLADMQKNATAIAQAWGLNDAVPGVPGRARQGTKPWTPKPAETPAAAETKSPYQTFIEELDRMIAKSREGEYASLRLKAAQLAEKEGIKDLAAAYDKINQIQRSDSQKVVDEFTRRLALETDQLAFQATILGRTADEQERLTYARQKYLEVEQQIEQAKRSGKPLDPQAIDDLYAQADQGIATRNEIAKSIFDQQRTGQFGYDKAIQNYIQSASNMATQIGQAVTDGLRGAEDALVRFFQQGKVQIGDLVRAVEGDLLRLSVRQNFTVPLAQFLGLKGFANGGDPPVGVPSIVGENGPELFVPKSAGTVVPNSALGGREVNITTQIYVDSRADSAVIYSTVSRALEINNRAWADKFAAAGITV